jgi:hypothetical protein
MNWDFLATRNARVSGALFGRIVFTSSEGLPCPVEPTLEYQAPFTLQNRETAYATVWAKLDNLKSYNHDKDL